MKNRLLLGALFVVLMSNVKAMEESKNYINTDILRFEKTVVEEEEKQFTGELELGDEINAPTSEAIGSMEVIEIASGILGDVEENRGIISENIVAITRNATAGNGKSTVSVTVRDSGSGVQGDIKENTGIILGNAVVISAEAVGTESATAHANLYGSANGVIGNVEENNGIISGNAVVMAGIATSNGPSVANANIMEESAIGVLGDVKKNNGVISASATLTGGHTTINDGTSSVTGAPGSNANGGAPSAIGILGDIEKNSGVITGEAVLIGGTTLINDVVQNFSTNAMASSNKNGIGVYGNVTENKGVITGDLLLEGGISHSTTISSTGTPNSNANISGTESGNGVLGSVEKNAGIILGSATIIGGEATAIFDGKKPAVAVHSLSNKASNGIYGNLEKNSGTVSGYVNSDSGMGTINEGTSYKDYEKIEFSGNGIALASIITKDIENTGLIKGTQSAIAAPEISGKVSNYGVMAGREIFSDGKELEKHGNTSSSSSTANKTLNKIELIAENNQGTYIVLEKDSSNKTKVALDTHGDVIVKDITVGRNLNGSSLGANDSEKKIVNAEIFEIDVIESVNDNLWEGDTVTAGKDSYIKVAGDTSYDNHIINGAGIKNAVLSVEEGVNINLVDSIVNGYKTALSLENNSVVTASNTVFNGGGLKGEDEVINIKGDSANLVIDGTSVINGLVTVSGKDSILNIGTEVIVNGDLKSGVNSNNTLNLGDKGEGELKLFHGIDGFTEINISGDVTAYETSTISTGDINIKNGNFVVRIDGTKVDDSGRITGHALYEHTGKIIINSTVKDANSLEETSDVDSDSMLNFKVSGLGVGTVIAMDGTDVSNFFDPQLGTMSIAHTAIKHKDETGMLTGDVEISISNFDDIFFPEEPEVPEIPEEPGETPEIPEDGEDSGYDGPYKDIYDSIVKGEELGHLAPTLDTENKTEEEARKGLLSLLDQIYANNPYIQSGKLSQENLGLFREQILTTKMPELGEWIVEGHGVYSLDENKNSKSVSVGNTSIKNEYSNELVTSGLLGTGEYGIRENTSLGFAVGGSYQNLDMSMNSKLKGEAIYLGAYGKKKVDNFTFTGGIGYQYGQYDGTRTILNEYQSIKNKGKVKTESFDIYGEAKYSFDNENYKVEPKLKLSQSFITQKSVSESNGALAIDMDKESYSIPEVEIGVDFLKLINIKTGKLESVFGLGVAKTFGKNDNYGTGKMKDSTNFKVEGPDFNDTKLRISAGLRYEYTNGMEYSVGLGVDISKDTDKEINGRLGVGYRF